MSAARQVAGGGFGNVGVGVSGKPPVVTLDLGNGYVSSHASTQPGEAAAAHVALAARWKEAKRDFDRDKAALSLTLRRVGDLAGVETVTHAASP